MKISLYWFKSKLCTTEEKNSEFRNIGTETIQNKGQGEKPLKKNYQKEGTASVFKEMIPRNFPNCKK